ncbi:hypothetical protein MHY87_12265 [Microvirga sp. ACRRW]|uniref:hypothetical protein n=1 Tax=Microvirga sp. ACRRW TaxID=2918205 RepID=UPI001EF4B3E6|nr:hypothetical protein [Microvirga sp. ACRRW]MCG7393683.1 hypothetical protein [Microvirga sp. ACRRW]
MARLNSRLEAEGAEFLVLGQLLIEGVPTFKTYTRNPDYDLVATNPENNKSARIQVKSRWATDYDGGFLISRFDFDFLVFVELNRGYRYARKASVENGKKSPSYYVFTPDLAKAALYEKSSWGKALLNRIPNVEHHREAWHLIKEYLADPLEN